MSTTTTCGELWSSTKVSLPACFGIFSVQDIWIISRNRWPGSVTAGPYLFRINSIDMTKFLHHLVRDLSKAVKLFLHSFVQSSMLSDLWNYTKHILSHLGKVQMSAESIIRIVSSTSLNEERKVFTLAVVTMAKEAIWKTRVKGINTGTFISSRGLMNFSAFISDGE